MPPTTTGLPRSDGLSRCSTEAKKASRSRCSKEGSRRTWSLSRASGGGERLRLSRDGYSHNSQVPPVAAICRGVRENSVLEVRLTTKDPHGYLAGQPVPARRHLRRCWSELCRLLRSRHPGGAVPDRRWGHGATR